MPDTVISRESFLSEVWDDYKSPTTSVFVQRYNDYRNLVLKSDEHMSSDKTSLVHLKKFTKEICKASSDLQANESSLANNLDDLSQTFQSYSPEQATAFQKFGVMTKNVALLLESLSNDISNCLLKPMDTIIDDFKTSYSKKNVEKTFKDYHTKFLKIEKEHKQLSKEYGMNRSSISAATVSEDLELERKMMQLSVCEYLIQANIAEKKRGVDILNHLVEYCNAWKQFFQEGLQTFEHFSHYTNESLVPLLHSIESQNDSEVQQLEELRKTLDEDIKTSKLSQSGHQSFGPNSIFHHSSCLMGDDEIQAHIAPSSIAKVALPGYEKVGHLLKRSEGLRQKWLRRRCVLRSGLFSIYHSDESKPPVNLNLLTCQVSLNPKEPLRFDVLSTSQKRTYHFQAESQIEFHVWISVLNSAKERLFQDAMSCSNSPIEEELRKTAIAKLITLEGNEHCADCDSPAPDWLSTNLGVLICLECCGIHRQLGVQISRTQSLKIDQINTSHLIIALGQGGNKFFNDVFEAKSILVKRDKPKPSSTLEERRKYILRKYSHKEFIIVTATDQVSLLQDLKSVVTEVHPNMQSLLQVYAEGVILYHPLPSMDDDQTALHLAITQQDATNLHIVDFLIQNGQNLMTLTKSEGNNPVHQAVLSRKPDCVKLLLRWDPDLAHKENKNGETSLVLARRLAKNENQAESTDVITDLILLAINEQRTLLQNINIDYYLMNIDDSIFEDFSDEDELNIRGPIFIEPKTKLVATAKQKSSVSENPYEMTGGNVNTLTVSPGSPGSGSNLKRSSSIQPSPRHYVPIDDRLSIASNYSPLKISSDMFPSSSTNSLNTLSKRESSISSNGESESVYDLLCTSYSIKSFPPRPPEQDYSPEKPPIPAREKPVPAKRIGKASVRDSLFSEIPASAYYENSPKLSNLDLPKYAQVNKPLKGEFKNGNGNADGNADDIKQRYKAIFDCTAENPDELSFKIDDILLKIRDHEDSGWLVGEIQGQSERQGIFPLDFVVPI